MTNFQAGFKAGVMAERRRNAFLIAGTIDDLDEVLALVKDDREREMLEQVLFCVLCTLAELVNHQEDLE